jgi:phenylalanyl-tRNA synthetase beta chain
MATEGQVRVRNPVTEEHTTLRATLLGSLLATLEKNVHRDYPQQVFEVGDVVRAGRGLPENARALAWVRAHSKAGFSEAKSVAMALVRDLRLDAEVRPFEAGPCIPGRCAALLAPGGEDKGVIGWFGELHPRTLAAFHLVQPAIAMELRLDAPALREA